MDSPVERYAIRVRNEWAFIYIDEASCVFTSYSSYGNYAYQWRSIGDCTLKAFLSDLDFSYFMSKTRREYLRFDADASIDGIKRHIIENRRDGSLTCEEARDAWDDLPGVDANSVDGFLNEFCASEALMRVYGGDYCDIARERPDSDSKGFWREIWPEFLKKIAAPTEVAA